MSSKLRDFSISLYRDLLDSLIAADYGFMTVEAFLSNSEHPDRYVIMRHDVDMNPENALVMARIEHELGLRTSYYFRIVPESYDEQVMRSIVLMGHELGYHYEDLSLAHGDYVLAYELYQRHLSSFKVFYPIKTVCMHGSPLSRWDNRTLWEHYDYKINGVIGEPYLDVCYNNILYLSDTGRSWLDARFVMRDRVESRLHHDTNSTFDLVAQSQAGSLPPRLMINVHPQRWHDELMPWIGELLSQNVKNVFKSLLRAIRS